MLRYDEIAEIVRVIDASSCEELILDTAELKLTIRRHGAGNLTQGEGRGAAPRDQRIAAAPPIPEPPAPQTVAKTAAPPVHGAVGGLEVTAPMVGTFYRAPSPGAPPFVEIGARVTMGDKLGLIEVMKLYTTIFADVSGRVVAICVADGTLVEYGQALFVIEPE